MRAANWELSAASRALAGEMLRKPVAGLIATAGWDQEHGQRDLRRFLVQQIESHAEKKLLITALACWKKKYRASS